MKSVLFLILLSVGCLCQPGEDRSKDYALERAAVLEAVRGLRIDSRHDESSLAALPVVGVRDIYAECGPKSLACWCQTPVCEQILIRSVDVGQERTAGFGTLMGAVLMHEYTHAVLPGDEEHGELFKTVLARALQEFGLKNDREYLE